MAPRKRAVAYTARPQSYFDDRTRRNFTRYQLKTIKQTFHFLSLPPEVRNMIYELSFDLESIERYFDQYWAYLQTFDRPQVYRNGVSPLKVEKKCPAVLLLCRQTYFEAIPLLQKMSVTFHHGLLNQPSIHSVLTNNVLRQLRSITITCEGHSVLAQPFQGTSWYGHMRLITNLGHVLATSHRLKNLTIDLRDQSLSEHLRCWHNPNVKCDFVNHTKEALKGLRNIRGIGNVTIEGLGPDPAFAGLIKIILESEPSRPKFLILPGEIRNKIYDHCISYSTISRALGRYVKYLAHRTAADTTTASSYPAISTPAILLLNRQIYHEAHSRLKSRTLNLHFPTTTHIHTETDIPNPFAFISKPSLRSIRHLHLRVDSWEWIFAIEELLQKLARQHSLKTFRFTFNDALKKDFDGVQGKIYPDRAIATCLKDMVNIRGVQEVVFAGDLPECFVGPIGRQMVAYGGQDTKEMPMALSWDRRVVNVEYDGDA